MRLFDTTFLVDLVNDDNGAARLAERIDAEKSFKAISVITVYEYLLGVHSIYSSTRQLPEKLDTANRDLGRFEALPLTSQIAQESSKIQAASQRRGRMLGINDLYIASTALAFKLTLVTRDLRDFKRVPGLKTETY